MFAAVPENKDELKSVGDEKQLLNVPLQVIEPWRTAQSRTTRSLACESEPLPSVELMDVVPVPEAQAGVTSGSSGVVVFVLLGP
jgi:hypothetical protein